MAHRGGLAATQKAGEVTALYSLVRYAEQTMPTRFSIHVGDITALDVDAIVNAANTSLLGGGGVDGAIHRAAGPELVAACRLLGGCKTGQAKATEGYRLPARFVIHTVGPVWRGGHGGERELLASCYRESLCRAREIGANSIAFPAISCGIYGFPIDVASGIAISTAIEECARDNDIEDVVFVCFSESDAEVYRREYAERGLAE